MNYKVYDMKGAEAGTIELNDGIFAVPVNPIVIHEAVKQYLANQRQGTQSTLTRTEVRGGGRRAQAVLVRAPSAHRSGRTAA